jgi:hypothetical protein
VNRIEQELTKRNNYKLPDALHPDAPRGPSITAIDRQALLTAIAAKLQARMADVVDQVYRVDAGSGTWWNVDPSTGRILFGLPWAEFSHRNWGLVRSECDLMRMCVRHFRKIEKGPFYFDKPTRKWHIDLARYPSIDSVHASPHTWVITPALILAADNHRRGLPYDGRQRG